jgi:hypothetical protein
MAAFREVAHGREWAGATQLHIAFEEVLERELIKRHGARRDARGSGGRTHAALLKSLGLTFVREDNGQLALTLAGEALAGGEPPAEILAGQVLKYQFPSAYSIGPHVGVASRFSLRPFVLLLRLLRDDSIGFLSEEEIALRVITLGERHSPSETTRVAQKVLEFRDDGFSSLEPDFRTRFLSRRGDPARLEMALGDIANTAINWLQQTGVVEREGAQVWITPGLEGRVDSLIDQFGAIGLIPDPHRQESYQRRYGLPPGKRKDTRDLGRESASSSISLEALRVQTTLLSISRVELISKMPPSELTERIVKKTGFKHAVVQSILDELIPNSGRTLNQFLLGYASLARGGREGARDFEQATADVFEKIFGLDATHIGQTGRSPDVLVSSAGEWRLIVDTKAYEKGYSFPASDDRAMTEYVARFQAESGGLAGWTVLSSSFGPGVAKKVRNIHAATGVPGSVVGITAWLAVIQRFERGDLESRDLLRLLTLNREVTVEDVENA